MVNRQAQDFEKGVRSVTGRSGRDAYDAVVKKHWKQ